MITDKFVTANELHEIAQALDALTNAKNQLDHHQLVSVNLLQDEDGLGQTLKIHDSNGDLLGHIGHGLDGDFVLYLDNGEEE